MKMLLLSAFVISFQSSESMNSSSPNPDPRMRIAALVNPFNVNPSPLRPFPLPLYEPIVLGSPTAIQQKLLAHNLQDLDACTRLSHKLGNNVLYPFNIAVVTSLALHLYKELSSFPEPLKLKDIVSLLLQEHPASFKALEDSYCFGTDHPQDLPQNEP